MAIVKLNCRGTIIEIDPDKIGYQPEDHLIIFPEELGS